MNRRYWIIPFMLAVFAWGAVVPSLMAAAPAEKGKAPEAYYPEKIHRFESIMEGVEIKHDFYVENHGDAPLEIRKVQPD